MCIRRAFFCVLSVLLSLSCNLLYKNPTNQYRRVPFSSQYLRVLFPPFPCFPCFPHFPVSPVSPVSPVFPFSPFSLFTPFSPFSPFPIPLLSTAFACPAFTCHCPLFDLHSSSVRPPLSSVRCSLVQRSLIQHLLVQCLLVQRSPTSILYWAFTRPVFAHLCPLSGVHSSSIRPPSPPSLALSCPAFVCLFPRPNTFK